ncbi:hypothetical protein QZM64_26645 [Burkholderia cepacia]|uniref:hypothetical protein n=1 Tax=Burkholderia TaxID=32008 RepID=UPI0005B4FF1D|nr:MULTISPECIES: hypothetical protein [Burkholderia]MDN7442745.1 hypothetical protein [Burkholderia cepacia]
MTDRASRRQLDLLGSPRWQWLDELLRIWYVRALDSADGCSPDELADISARLNFVMPATLAEWFELVGHRLESVQDAPATPLTVRVQDGLVSVWTENQAVWTLLVGAGNDPMCQIDSSDFCFPATPLSQALHGMTLSDTLVGAWDGNGRGPLGDLASSVVGGVIEDATDDEVARVLSAFPQLKVPGNPFYNVPPYGDGTTILRDGIGLEWAVATAEAFEHIDALVPLEPPGGRYRVSLELPTAVARQVGLIGRSAIPDLNAIHLPSELARPATGSVSQLSASFEWETAQPEKCMSAVRNALPETERALAKITYRPERIAHWRTVESDGGVDDAR